jgi:hypothetical protein
MAYQNPHTQDKRDQNREIPPITAQFTGSEGSANVVAV